MKIGTSHTTETKERIKKLIKKNPNHVRVIEKMAERERKGERIVKGTILKEVGYSKEVQTHPEKVFNKRSFIELADELLPDTLILESLRDDIKGKPKRRYQELALGAKIKGMLVDRVENKTTIQGFVFLPPRVPQGTENTTIPVQPATTNAEVVDVSPVALPSISEGVPPK